MDFSKLHRGELVAMVGGGLLLISVLLLTGYKTDAGNLNSHIDDARGTLTMWEVHPLMRWLLIAGALAPFILGWIIIRDHELSWPRGQVTSIVAIAALGLLFYSGIVDRPGEPSGTISLGIGWYGAILGAVLMLVGSFLRSEETAAVRKPPGVL